MSEVIVFPAKMIKAGAPAKTASNEAQLNAFTRQGYALESEKPEPQKEKKNGNGGKRRLSYEEAVRMSDRQLAESFGMPSELEALCKDARDNGYVYEDTLTIVDCIEQISKKTSLPFPSTQVDWNGQLFCVLFDRSHIVGEARSFSCPESDKTKSGFTVSVGS